MKKPFSIISISLSMICAAAQAQVPVSADKAVPGYEPTVFSSKDQVQKLFDDMPWSFRAPSVMGLNQGSQCYMRAHMWSYDSFRNQNVKLMKAFVFYTHTYKEWHKKKFHKKFDWWFHVTPYTLVKNAETQQIEEWTLDATFSDEIQNMKPWTDLFVRSGKKCAEYVPYEKFKCEVMGVHTEKNPTGCEEAIRGTEHCYIVRTAGTVYDPDEIEAAHASNRTRFEWDANAKDKLCESIDKAPLNSSTKFWLERLNASKRDKNCYFR